LGNAAPCRTIPEEKMAVASNKPAAQPATARGAVERPAAVPEFNQEQELHAYRHMLLIRRFEEKAGQLYGMGLIGGFCHLYIGQEAVVIGMQMAIKGGDKVITGYRDHGHMLAGGMDPKGVMAELTGRQHGYSKGKGGSMHMFSVETGFYGGHGIVAAQVPLGTGLAFANRYRGNDNVALTYLGDGAANQGQVYESFNMAKLWSLPVIYIIGCSGLSHDPAVQARSIVRYSRRAGRWDGCAGSQGRRRQGGAALPRRQGSGHSRDAHLPISGPFHVGPGEISQQGGGRQDAHRARSDRAGAQPRAQEGLRERRHIKEGGR
jgi:pyruvate dehydrogenase E1 component alpha subunit